MLPTMAEPVEQIEQVEREANAELAVVKTAAELEQFRIKYLGSNGKVKGLMKLLGALPKEQKPQFGQKVNALNNTVSEAFKSKQVELGSGEQGVRDAFDITEPGTTPLIG